MKGSSFFDRGSFHRLASGDKVERRGPEVYPVQGLHSRTHMRAGAHCPEDAASNRPSFINVETTLCS